MKDNAHHQRGAASLAGTRADAHVRFQTHPADGNCGIIVTTKEKARELSPDPKVEAQIISYGYARAPKAHMGMAPVPAANGFRKSRPFQKDIKAHKSHNPFVINDLYFAQNSN
jgi:hypothetical protein